MLLNRRVTMRKIAFITLIYYCSLFPQTNSHYSGNDLFFLNDSFGAVITQNRTLSITNDGAKTWRDVRINIVSAGAVMEDVLFTSE